MPITTKALRTTIVDDTNATKGILYFDGQFFTTDGDLEFSKDRQWVNFDFGIPEGTLMKMDVDNIRWGNPYTEYTVWPCRVGLWHDKSVVDVEYDFDNPPLKVYPRILQPGQTWDDVDWDSWTE